MLYKYNVKGEVIVQVNSPTDYHNFDTLITDNISSALIDGWFLTAKEAMENYFKKDDVVKTQPKCGRHKK